MPWTNQGGGGDDNGGPRKGPWGHEPGPQRRGDPLRQIRDYLRGAIRNAVNGTFRQRLRLLRGEDIFVFGADQVGDVDCEDRLALPDVLPGLVGKYTANPS